MKKSELLELLDMLPEDAEIKISGTSLIHDSTVRIRKVTPRSTPAWGIDPSYFVLEDRSGR